MSQLTHYHLVEDHLRAAMVAAMKLSPLPYDTLKHMAALAQWAKDNGGERSKTKVKVRKDAVSQSHCNYYIGKQHIGAVWQDERDGPWSAHCTSGIELGLYGHLGNFETLLLAEKCLLQRAAGDITAKGVGI